VFGIFCILYLSSINLNWTDQCTPKDEINL